MIRNGFTPEWIRLSKEIKEEIEELEKKLTEARNKLTEPLDLNGQKTWKRILENFLEIEKNINNKIDRYNFLVPILQKQRFKIDLEKMAEEILSKPREIFVTPENKQVNENREFFGNFFYETRKS